MTTENSIEIKPAIKMIEVAAFTVAKLTSGTEKQNAYANAKRQTAIEDCVQIANKHISSNNLRVGNNRVREGNRLYKQAFIAKMLEVLKDKDIQRWINENSAVGGSMLTEAMAAGDEAENNYLKETRSAF